MRTNTFGKVISALKRSAARFKRDTSGNLQIMLALSAAPLFGFAGMAIDYNRTLDAMVEIQDLADRAALFGASLIGTATDQEAAANLFLEKNEIARSGITYTAAVTHGVDSVAVAVNTEVDGTLFKAFYKARNEDVALAKLRPEILSRAKFIREADKMVCVLALDNNDAQAFHLQGNGGFEANGCGVHSDSTHVTQAIYMNGGATGDADFFHTVGGWSKAGNSGVFEPEPEDNVETFGNPFASTLPVNCPSSVNNNDSASNSSTSGSPTTFGGTAYNNLSIGSNRFAAITSSIVYVYGTIDIKGTLTAPNTTIVLCGANAKIAMGAQAEFRIQAPTTGQFAGFAVVGDNAATSQSSLRGGAGTHLRGMWYTPNAGLDIGGNSEFNANSEYFPVVVNKFLVSGTGKVNISVDHDAYDYDKRPELVKTGELRVWLSKYDETSVTD